MEIGLKEKNLKWFAKDSDGDLTIYIPEDLKLEEIKIKNFDEARRPRR